jgi:hypothetical protein
MRNTNRSGRTAIIFPILALCLAQSAKANPIVIFNSGTDNTGNVLSTGSVDPHYPLVSSPIGSGAAFVVDLGSGSPITPSGPWLADNSVSEWTAPAADQSHFTTLGQYDYHTTFSLAGLNPSTAVLEGNWTSDNAAVIDLNGNPTGNTLSSEPFGAFSPFFITSGFTSGVNVLDFIVTNSPAGSAIADPTRLNVDFTSAAASPSTSPSIPEPSAFAIMLAGIGGLSWFRRRRPKRMLAGC